MKVNTQKCKKMQKNEKSSFGHSRGNQHFNSVKLCVERDNRSFNSLSAKISEFFSVPEMAFIKKSLNNTRDVGLRFLYCWQASNGWFVWILRYNVHLFYLWSVSFMVQPILQKWPLYNGNCVESNCTWVEMYAPWHSYMRRGHERNTNIRSVTSVQGVTSDRWHTPTHGANYLTDLVAV